MPSVKRVRPFDGTTKNVHVDQQEANGELKCIGLEEKKSRTRSFRAVAAHRKPHTNCGCANAAKTKSTNFFGHKLYSIKNDISIRKVNKI